MRATAFPDRSFRLAAIAVLLLLTACSTPPAPDREQVTALVSNFGAKLQLVSLLAPRDVAARAIREHYGPFVTAELLERWTAEPAAAPGRQTSSPWPDRIDITAASPAAAGSYVVAGEIVEMTSTGPAGRVPVRLTLIQTPAGWRIDGFEMRERQQPVEPGATPAVSVIESYYAAINAKDYGRAYRYWRGEGQASGQTFDQFRNGFANTAAVEVLVGEPGRIEPAAGSRYVEVPVEINARTKSGERQHFRGTYTLQRSVVDGATEEQRQWRISAASIAAVPPS